MAQRLFNWALESEIGVSYSGACSENCEMRFPTFVEYCDGIFLFVDEFEVGRFRTRCVNRQKQDIFDSLSMGMSDGLGCFLQFNQIALLNRDIRKISIVDLGAKSASTIDLAAISEFRPCLLRRASNDALLVLGISSDEKNWLFEIDLQGNVETCLTLGSSATSRITSIHKTRDGNYLIADSSSHFVTKLTPKGEEIWHHGEFGEPGAGDRFLNTPSAIAEGYGDELLIADTRNHRLIVTSCPGYRRKCLGLDSNLCSPTYFAPTQGGAYCIADAGNRRIIEIDWTGNIIWVLGSALYDKRLLSFPRSIEPLESNGTLVADTCNNRVVAFNSSGNLIWSYGGNDAMTWPRCARQMTSETVLIADSLRSRLIFVHRGKTTIGEIDLKPLARDYPPDIHDIRIVSSGLLLTDTRNARVLWLNWRNEVDSVFTHAKLDDFSDPHAADARGDTMAIADTGNSRIVLFDLKTQDCVELTEFFHEEGSATFRRPRYVQLLPDRRLVVVDTGNNRVLIGTIDGRLISCVSSVPESPITCLNQPRSAYVSPDKALWISDYFNHRVLRFCPKMASDL
jgi:hypothetical protein